MEFDSKEVERIQTVKGAIGMKSTPELFRVLLTEKYNQVIGSPNPMKSRK